MRLWHKDLIPVLPRAQLVSQWRECSAIAKNLLKDGTPNHILVNKVLDYPIEHFVWYSMYVRIEMTKRGYRTMQRVADGIWQLLPDNKEQKVEVDYSELFKDWHNKRYFDQCFYNLQEKYDCGGLTEEEYKRLI